MESVLNSSFRDCPRTRLLCLALAATVSDDGSIKGLFRDICILYIYVYIGFIRGNSERERERDIYIYTYYTYNGHA